jgi:hypothetical protein
MKRVMWLVVLVVVALAVQPATADFYVIGGGGKVGTQINSLPYTISTSGFYYLGKNLTYSVTAGSAIFVDADDVTLDLMGFCLSGPGKTSGTPSGIWVLANRKSVEIRNGSVQGFGNVGIYGDPATYGVRVTGLKVRDTGTTGIGLLGINNLVTDCSVMNAGYHGIHAGTGSLVKGNHVYNSPQWGINASNGVLVIGNVLLGNINGINTGYSSSVSDNSVSGPSGPPGISCVGGWCTVTRNTVNMGTIQGGQFCTITNNTAVDITTGVSCTIAYNTTVNTAP